MSYCHADEAWAAWLHKTLESYRVPRRLVGKKGLHGPVTAKLSPIFRDRDELSSASDLSAKIKSAIADSESLLLVCSPAAARSQWVNEEIRHFRSLGKHRIYCVIVDGIPELSDQEQCCFPPALLEGDDRTHEPLAADVRKWADGKPLAKLKLVAGLLGVRLDELRQREQQRKRKRQILTTAGIVAAAALLVFTLQSRLAERDARMAQEAQQFLAENMLAQFLEQSERLGDVADLETRKAFAEALSSYLADLDPADLTPESRRQLGVALANRGVILRDEGQLEQSLEVFNSARQVLHLLVEEAGEDEQALFELSQVEYWIGQVHLDLGRMKQAEVSFRAYADISNALHEKAPGNADWTMEAAYAQSNLGNLASRRVPSDPNAVLRNFRLALELNEEAARLDSKYERELAESHAYLADAWLDVCDLEQAMDQRLKNVELAAKYFEQSPASNQLKQDYANALSGLSKVQQKRGLISPAVESMSKSVSLQGELVDEDPSNLGKHWNLVRKSMFLAQIFSFSGDREKSWALTVSIAADLKNLVDQSPDIHIYSSIAYGIFQRHYADQAYQKGEISLANSMLEESFNHLRAIADQHPDNKKVQFELTLSYYDYWHRHSGQFPNTAARDWLISLEGSFNLAGCSDLDLASRRAVMLASPDQARDYVSRLLDRDYKESEFMRFCTSQKLCAVQADF